MSAKRRNIFLSTAMVLSSVLVPSVAMCPYKCDCDDTNLIVTCIRAGLEVMPNTLNPRLKTIIYRHNDFSSVDVSLVFLSNLIKVDLSHNRIMSVMDKAFRNQKSLKHLKLDGNKIGQVSNETFYGLGQMEVLSMRANEVIQLPENVLINSKELQKLDLAKNRIAELNKSSFSGLQNLRILHLEDNHLSEIPRETFIELSKLAELYLSGNPLKVIGTGVFGRLGSLTSLDLSSCGLETLAKDAFRGLASLRRLKIADNKLTRVPTSTFVHVSYLRDIALGRNPFETIGDGAFKPLTRLRSLDLSGCGKLKAIGSGAFLGCVDLERVTISLNRVLSSIAETAFDATPNLRHLSLADNKLGVVSESMVPWRRLRHLELSGNPWHCDCHLRFLPDVLSYLRQNDTNTVIAGQCSSPGVLHGTSLHDVQPAPCEARVPVTVVRDPVSGAEGKEGNYDDHVENKIPYNDRMNVSGDPNGTAIAISVSLVVIVLFLTMTGFAVFRCRQRRRSMLSSSPVTVYGESNNDWLRNFRENFAGGGDGSAKSRYADSETLRQPAASSQLHQYQHVYMHHHPGSVNPSVYLQNPSPRRDNTLSAVIKAEAVEPRMTVATDDEYFYVAAPRQQPQLTTTTSRSPRNSSKPLSDGRTAQHPRHVPITVL